jgi:hypothetical protein
MLIIGFNETMSVCKKEDADNIAKRLEYLKKIFRSLALYRYGD